MSGLIDPEAPYPHGCGPDCKGCDPCVCGHPWSEHTDPRYEFGTGCLDVSGLALPVRAHRIVAPRYRH